MKLTIEREHGDPSKVEITLNDGAHLQEMAETIHSLLVAHGWLPSQVVEMAEDIVEKYGDYDKDESEEGNEALEVKVTVDENKETNFEWSDQVEERDSSSSDSTSREGGSSTSDEARESDEVSKVPIDASLKAIKAISALKARYPKFDWKVTDSKPVPAARTEEEIASFQRLVAELNKAHGEFLLKHYKNINAKHEK